jgi:transcriptional regulator with XRE-family HTH domain
MDILKHTLLDGVKHTLTDTNYDCGMSTLEERVLEAIKATGMKVPVLAEKIGVSVQSVYDWMRGKSLGDMKADNLIELAYLAGYEPRWIRKEKGLKKKVITKEQEIILELAENMIPESKDNWIAIGKSLTAVIPTQSAVDTLPSQPLDLKASDEQKTPAGPKRLGTNEGIPRENSSGRFVGKLKPVEKRTARIEVAKDRRKTPWKYEGE